MLLGSQSFGVPRFQKLIDIGNSLMKKQVAEKARDFREVAVAEEQNTKETLDAIVEKLLAIAIESGMDRRALSASFNRHLYNQRELSTKIVRQENVSGVTNDLLSRVIQRWHLDSTFMDPTGLPKLLSRTGRGSLKTLLSAIMCDVSVDDVWHELIRSGVAEIVSGTKIRVLTRMLIGTRERQIVTSLNTLLGVVSTIHHNLKTRDKRLRLCHRIVTDSFVPESRLLEFSAVVERQANAALGSIDEWCNNARAGIEEPEKLHSVRVHFLLAPDSISNYKRGMKVSTKGRSGDRLRSAVSARLLHSSSASFVRGVPPPGPRKEIVARFVRESKTS